MSSVRNSIKDAIERKVGNGDWNGVAVPGGYEASLDSVDIDPDTIEVQDIDLDSGTLTVTASGDGITTHKDVNSLEMPGLHDVEITATIDISTGDAKIRGVSNTD